MLNGPRGQREKHAVSLPYAGLPEMTELDCTVHDLPFYGVLVSIKNTSPNLTELRRLTDDSARAILNEHALACFVAARLFQSISATVPTKICSDWLDPARRLFDHLRRLLALSGGRPEPTLDSQTTLVGILDACRETCEGGVCGGQSVCKTYCVRPRRGSGISRRFMRLYDVSLSHPA